MSGAKVVEMFKQGKHDNELIDIYSNMLEQFDMIWMKHTDNKDAIAALFSMKKVFNCKIVWDFDDDLFNVRESQPAWKEYAPSSEKRAYVGAAMSYCDALTVSTEYLKKSLGDRIKKIYNIDMPIYVCPNFVNVDEWTNVKYRPSNSPTIGYYGSTTHNEDYAMIKPVIYKLLQKYPLLRFEIMGAMHSDEVVELFRDCPELSLLDRIRLNGGTTGWNGFPELLLRQNWDIALAPLLDDEFNRAKSNIKWMETAMKSIPCVCSNVQPYSESIPKGTGYVINDDEWFKTLSKLIDNPDLRVRVGKAAKKEIITNWNADKKIKLWSKALDSILE